ncbi:hypothetical protein BGX27_010690 [Mortierella sp. AM989]|nr:hypothetical protein BGX27_010690 [Mortierella sp. AM989]
MATAEVLVKGAVPYATRSIKKMHQSLKALSATPSSVDRNQQDNGKRLLDEDDSTEEATLDQYDATTDEEIINIIDESYESDPDLQEGLSYTATDEGVTQEPTTRSRKKRKTELELFESRGKAAFTKRYNSLSTKWTLLSGTVVEDVLYEAGVCSIQCCTLIYDRYDGPMGGKQIFYL